MDAALVAGFLGVIQGVRHALEPDHLAAVSTLAGDRPGLRSGFWLGASWGLGHTLSLVAFGGTLCALGAHLPQRWGAAFELTVGLMLVALGVRAVIAAAKEGSTGFHHAHAHHGLVHAHLGPKAHVHTGKWVFATQPLLIGLVHGLAGSGALSALVLAELPDTSHRLGFISLFAIGSVVGMACLTSLVSAPLAKLRRAGAWASRVLVVVGLLTVGLGVFWAASSASIVLGS